MLRRVSGDTGISGTEIRSDIALELHTVGARRVERDTQRVQQMRPTLGGLLSDPPPLFYFISYFILFLFFTYFLFVPFFFLLRRRGC